MTELLEQAHFYEDNYFTKIAHGTNTFETSFDLYFYI